jgi:hypothetical protein
MRIRKCKSESVELSSGMNFLKGQETRLNRLTWFLALLEDYIILANCENHKTKGIVYKADIVSKCLLYYLLWYYLNEGAYKLTSEINMVQF